MTYVHTRTFHVRHYECDAFGRVDHANYLRYMQEAAFDASAAVGYYIERYAEIGYRWLAYETDIEYIQPLRYNDAVEIKTWVADFRRVRSLRHYEMYRAGELVAHASTDWVLLNTEAMYPATIPDDIIQAYSAGDPPPPAPPRKPLPAALQPKSGGFALRRRVEWRDIDPAVHVNNAVYLNYVTDCALQAYAAQGWPITRLHAEGHILRTQRHQIEYKQAALLDDEVEVMTWISGVEADAMTQHFTITRTSDNKMLNRVRAAVVCVDAAGDPVPLPDHLLNDFAPLIAG